MLRLLILALVAIAILLVIESLLRRLRRALGEAARRVAPGGRGEAPAGAARTLDRLVPCVACGVRVPERRALTAPGDVAGVYCSEACRRTAGDHRTAAS